MKTHLSSSIDNVCIYQCFATRTSKASSVWPLKAGNRHLSRGDISPYISEQRSVTKNLMLFVCIHLVLCCPLLVTVCYCFLEAGPTTSWCCSSCWSDRGRKGFFFGCLCIHTGGNPEIFEWSASYSWVCSSSCPRLSFHRSGISFIWLVTHRRRCLRDSTLRQRNTVFCIITGVCHCQLMVTYSKINREVILRYFSSSVLQGICLLTLQGNNFHIHSARKGSGREQQDEGESHEMLFVVVWFDMSMVNHTDSALLVFP